MGLLALGTKGSWDIWLLGQNVFGTFGFWDKSLDFRIFLEQMALGQNVIGTIYLWAGSVWDNSPTEQKSLGQFTRGHCVLHQNWQNCLAGQKSDGNLRCWT